MSSLACSGIHAAWIARRKPPDSARQMGFKKADIEASLQQEQQLIQGGAIKEDNPLDLSEVFRSLCEACRRGDLKGCQEAISEGANINARDLFDYTPLILGSLCGHYEVVRLLLESGALCERDTFQGERCLYNALNDKIRKLLLEYDYSKTSDPLQPFAAHITSLLTREHPQTSDIVVASASDSFHLHKLILSARSPYFSHKLANAPETSSWKLPSSLSPQAFSVAIRYLYFGEVPNEISSGAGAGFSEEEIVEGIDRITHILGIRSLFGDILEGNDRRYARQRRLLEVERGRNQFETWFTENTLRHRIVTSVTKVHEVRWDRENGLFADVLLRADESDHAGQVSAVTEDKIASGDTRSSSGIPVGPTSKSSRSPSPALQLQNYRKSVLFPVHKAMLLRSEYFATMFSSSFREAQSHQYLQVVKIDCVPEVLEIVLAFIYAEKTDIPLELALDVLYAADSLFLEKLKTRAAVIISTLGSGNVAHDHSHRGKLGEGTPTEHGLVATELDIYEIIRAGWQLHVSRLEEFGARFIALRLEYFIDDPQFEGIVRESADRIQVRQETDTIELIDDIRYYLSERFRLRFKDSYIEEMEEDINVMDTKAQTDQAGNTSPRKVSTETSGADAHPANARTNDHKFELSDTSQIRTLDGDVVEDALEVEEMNYQILLNKIDRLLEKLKLDA